MLPRTCPPDLVPVPQVVEELGCPARVLGAHLGACRPTDRRCLPHSDFGGQDGGGFHRNQSNNGLLINVA